MLTITQAWLDMFPSWADAGWEVGDTFNEVTFLANHVEIQETLANHPPNGPHH